MTDQVFTPFVLTRARIDELDNPPNIAGVWVDAYREMCRRNPPPENDPYEVRGIPVRKSEMTISQSGDNHRIVHSVDDKDPNFLHESHGFYTGANAFAVRTTRTNRANGETSHLNAVWHYDPVSDALITEVVSAEGGHPSPDPRRDPPGNFMEAKKWERLAQPAGTTGPA